MSIIRPARVADLPALIQLLKDNALPFEDVTAPMLSHFSVLEALGEVRGCAGIEPLVKDGLLRSLVLHPSLRGSGSAHQLLAVAEQHAANEGIATLYLLTTTAAAFFEKNGYARVPRDAAPAALRATTQFATLCPASATCMAKALGVIIE